jgi:hypothetical protein
MKSKNTINHGFKLQDQHYLRHHDNAKADPEVQLFIAEDLEGEEPELRKYYCASCKSRLDYHNYLKVWICSECFEQYDTNIQDVPLKDTKELRVKTYPELSYYQTWDEEDPNTVFIESIDLGEQHNIPGNVAILRDDHRVKHIRVKGSPVEAMAAMNQLDG